LKIKLKKKEANITIIKMSAGPIVVEVISLFLIVLFLLHKYSSFKQQNVITLVAVFIAWYFSFMIIVLLPLDISLVILT
jgi:hypothetical protein